MKHVMPAAACIAIVATATACGGDEGLPAAEYVARADAVCADANSAAEKLGPRPGGDPGLLARWWDDFSEIGTGALAEIRNLPPPDEDGDAVEAMLAGTSEPTSSRVSTRTRFARRTACSRPSSTAKATTR
jgi:hypothetical protein